MSLEFIDTHCHIQSLGSDTGERSTRELWAKAGDLSAEQVLSSAQEAGVSKMVCVGCDLEDSELAIAFAAERRDVCRASIGLHPHEAQHYHDQPEKLAQFAALALKSEVVAIGECGLDYFYEHSTKEAQIAILRFQFELAQKHDLPMIFHVREAFDDFWPIFDEYHAQKPIRGVLHSFTDTIKNATAGADRGLYIGVNGIATFAKGDAQKAMYRSISLQNLVLETDAPFLTPTPYRGKINEPKYLQQIANFLAELRGEDVQTIASASTANAIKLFGL